MHARDSGEASFVPESHQQRMSCHNYCVCLLLLGPEQPLPFFLPTAPPRLYSIVYAGSRMGVVSEITDAEFPPPFFSLECLAEYDAGNGRSQGQRLLVLYADTRDGLAFHFRCCSFF